MNSTLKKALAIGTGVYFAAYSVLSAYALLDYRKNKQSITENAPDHLLVRKYSADIGGRKKNIALVGENRNYTNKEMRHAAGLIDNYDAVGLEGSMNPSKKELLRKITRNIDKLPYSFYKMGSGRTALNSAVISGILKRASMEKVYPLEEKNPFDSIHTKQKVSELFGSIFYLLTAPLQYFVGKNEKNISLKGYNKNIEKKRASFSDEYCNSKEREQEMSNKIESIMNKKDVDSLVCFVGGYHLKPIANALHAKMKIEEKNGH